MNISRAWLQKYFTAPLPDAQALADALTFHAFEIESVEKEGADDVLDVKITANRGHDCLSHRGIAKELSAILKLPLNTEKDPFAKEPDLSKKTGAVSVSIDDPRCKRYVAGYVRGVKVGPSPEWLKRSLESIGQRSINNVVDATNFVMFDTGQPLHAFDAGQLQEKNGYAIAVRAATKGEAMLALDDKDYILDDSMLVISDAHSGAAIGIAGVKGGKPAGITEATTDIIIESANFDGVSTRKTAQALKLKTDASDRFQQVITPELAAYGMQQVVDLISALAGGEVEGFVDAYPSPVAQAPVAVSLPRVNGILGTRLQQEDVADAFARLGFSFSREGDVFTVQPPFERLDIVIPEDLVEEVGRIVGYDAVPSEQLPTVPVPVVVNRNFYAAEKAREELMGQEYSEVCTSVFADTGERAVANKIGGERPYLRTTLLDGLRDAYERNIRNKDLLGLADTKLFEIGLVWKGGAEVLMIGTAEKGKVEERPLEPLAADSYDDLPVSQASRYAPFSKYPAIIRDIAMWVSEGTASESVLSVIRPAAGELLVRADAFDEFKKGERVSRAFHLVFQSFEKTLTDEEVNAVMEGVYAAVKGQGWEVR